MAADDQALCIARMLLLKVLFQLSLNSMASALQGVNDFWVLQRMTVLWWAVSTWLSLLICQCALFKSSSFIICYDVLFGLLDCGLTHWPLGDEVLIMKTHMKTHIIDRPLEYFLWNYPQMNVTRLHWWYVNIGSGNGLVPIGNKPLPELMLT